VREAIGGQPLEQKKLSAIRLKAFRSSLALEQGQSLNDLGVRLPEMKGQRRFFDGDRWLFPLVFDQAGKRNDLVCEGFNRPWVRADLLFIPDRDLPLPIKMGFSPDHPIPAEVAEQFCYAVMKRAP